MAEYWDPVSSTNSKTQSSFSLSDSMILTLQGSPRHLNSCAVIGEVFRTHLRGLRLLGGLLRGGFELLATMGTAQPATGVPLQRPEPVAGDDPAAVRALDEVGALSHSGHARPGDHAGPLCHVEPVVFGGIPGVPVAFFTIDRFAVTDLDVQRPEVPVALAAADLAARAHRGHRVARL